jgi:hypothetical protein
MLQEYIMDHAGLFPSMHFKPPLSGGARLMEKIAENAKILIVQRR